MEKIKWFAEGTLVSAWVIGAWILGDSVLGHTVGTAYLVGVAALLWLSWTFTMEVSVVIGIMVAFIGFLIGLSLGPVAVVVIASVAYGLDRNERFPAGSGRTTIGTLVISVPSVIIFASTIHMWGWQTALIATAVMMIAQLVLLYLPERREQHTAA